MIPQKFKYYNNEHFLSRRLWSYIVYERLYRQLEGLFNISKPCVQIRHDANIAVTENANKQLIYLGGKRISKTKSRF